MDFDLCVGLFVGGLVLFILALIVGTIAYFRGKKAYYASLEQLKIDPHNPELREQVLNLGRKWANTARGLHSMGFKDVIVLDEVAMLNDINAACARAGSKVTIEADGRKPSIEERLKQLDDLRAKRLITEEEFRSRREQILKDV